MPDPASDGPLVSVAVSTFNGGRYLRAQLDSVLSQREVALEVVVRDDGSSDASTAILAEYAARDPRLRWQANPTNLGATASFEAAMADCKGAFIAPCDQDDVWEADKLPRLLDALGTADLVYADSSFIDAQGHPLGRRVSESMPMLYGTQPLTFLLANSVSGHASLVRREVFARARPFPQGAYHDWWLALCAAGGQGVVYLDAPLVHYRRHEAAISPMGAVGGSPRDAAASRIWLAHRLRLMRAYATRGLRDAELAARFADALEAAIDGGAKASLWRLLWQHRGALPRWKGVPVLDALKWQSRFAKRLRRASERAP